MKALISKIESVESGYRVAQVETDDKIFPVSDDLEWIDCPEGCVADIFWYDPTEKSFKLNPIYIVKTPEQQTQPTVQGAQTL